MSHSLPAATPMMRQYQEIRTGLPPRTILFFRLGDFYEMFGEDARVAAPILEVALTKRGELPMCGVPFHSARAYIEKLVAAGWRVALCEQTGEVRPGKLVQRHITEIISAGTLDAAEASGRAPRYIAAVCSGQGEGWGLALCDPGTGEFFVSQAAGPAELADELARSQPAEIVAPEGTSLPQPLPQFHALEPSLFLSPHALETLRTHFGLHSLDGLGCGDLPDALRAAGALVHYLKVELRRNASHLRLPRPVRQSRHLILDAAAQEHLELTASRAGPSMTLLGTLDCSASPMGARALREWILRPLREPAEIHERQQAIGALLAHPAALEELRQHLACVRDIQRCAARLGGGSGSARDLAALATSLQALPALQNAIQALPPDPLLGRLAGAIEPLPELAAVLRQAVVDDPPAAIREGGMIRDGFDPVLDELRAALRDGKTWIASLQEREIARTGIKSLKVRFNSVFGYYIEVTKANLASVPADYIRRQTTVGAERFVTPELKEWEAKILGADERARARELEIFGELREQTLVHTRSLQTTAEALGALDALAALALTARTRGWNRPVVDDSGVLEIREGRHPVLEALPGAERFVPNDTQLDMGGARFAIITGPNMAGKSTYLRQVALLVLLAQTGSFIPAASARIGIVDRIFTRVGASDDLARGQSTFMVEMNEAASILNNATPRSLVILDEIGRGTSTFDGLAIAWSIAEYLHDRVGCRALFATHYHEMTDLARSRPGVINLNVAVREWNDHVIFLRKIVPGRADRSYGIQVARLAGLPREVLDRAKEILANLERAELSAEGEAAFATARKKRAAARGLAAQLELL